MKKKVGIIGSGISGASFGHMAKSSKDFECTLFERNKKPGGLIRCKEINGALYHLTGGHVFNSKSEEVLNWFWSIFDKRDFLLAKRHATIKTKYGLIEYPIENNLNILPEDIVEKIITEILETSENFKPKNFKEFLSSRFGSTLCDLYFFPYNEKIWKIDLAEIPLEWLEGKLPMPNKKDIFLSNIKNKKESEMVHSTFYYPKKGGSQFIIDHLLTDQKVISSYEIKSIEFLENKIVLNQEHKFDKIIFTGNVKELPGIIRSSNNKIKTLLKNVQGLRSNGTTNVFCECGDEISSWQYLPNPKIKSHRIIFTGNFSKANNGIYNNTCVVEFSGELSSNQIQEEISKMKCNLNIIDFRYTPFSYVIQDNESRKIINELKSILSLNNMYLHGRFAEWEYKNMDTCILDSINLIKQITI